MIPCSPLALGRLLPLWCLLIVVTSFSHFAVGGEARRELRGYAQHTWNSIAAMTSPTGLPYDGLLFEGSHVIKKVPTSPTNMGAYLWSVVAAQSLSLIEPAEAEERIDRALEALLRLETDDGAFFNWYDASTGEKLTCWPGTSEQMRPFVSSVDNAWLEVGLRIAAEQYPRQRKKAERIVAKMSYGRFARPATPAEAGQALPKEAARMFSVGYVPGDKPYEAVYDSLNTETRIVPYLAIMRGETEAGVLQAMLRATIDKDRLREQTADAIPECDLKLRPALPSWGGSMFEALMVPLFVPEEVWAPQSWGVNHTAYVLAQIHYGLVHADVGARTPGECRPPVWGFSPCRDPDAGYCERGVPWLGIAVKGYSPGQSGAVVTPHAVFLALRFAKPQALESLAALDNDFACYGDMGFFDAVNVRTKNVSRSVLALDQAMILAALGNDLAGDVLRNLFASTAGAQALRGALQAIHFEPRDVPLTTEVRLRR